MRKLTSILRQLTIPPPLNSIHIKPLLRQLGRILTEHGPSTSLKYQKRHNRPEHPGKLEYLLELELLVFLRQGLFGGYVLSALEVSVAVAVEELENHSSGVGEEVHEYGCPEDPGKVAGLLLVS